MRRASVDFLQAPVTAARLALEPLEVTGDDVVAGRLIEPDTGAWYRIDDGIADLVPSEYRNAARYEAFCRKHRLEHGPAPRGVGKPDDNTLKQIRFFSGGEAYEAEVVTSPFYDVFDRVTVGRWIASHPFCKSAGRRGRLRLRTTNDSDAQGGRGCDCGRSLGRPVETCAAQGPRRTVAWSCRFCRRDCREPAPARPLVRRRADLRQLASLLGSADSFNGDCPYHQAGGPILHHGAAQQPGALRLRLDDAPLESLEGRSQRRSALR